MAINSNSNPCSTNLKYSPEKENTRHIDKQWIAFLEIRYWSSYEESIGRNTRAIYDRDKDDKWYSRWTIWTQLIKRILASRCWPLSPQISVVWLSRRSPTSVRKILRSSLSLDYLSINFTVCTIDVDARTCRHYSYGLFNTLIANMGLEWSWYVCASVSVENGGSIHGSLRGL